MHFTIYFRFISSKSDTHNIQSPFSGLVGRATVCILRDMLCQINGSLQPSTMNATISLAATQRRWEAAKSSLRLLTNERASQQEKISVLQNTCVCRAVSSESLMFDARVGWGCTCKGWAYPKQRPKPVCVCERDSNRPCEIISIKTLTVEFLSDRRSFTVITCMIYFSRWYTVL